MALTGGVLGTGDLQRLSMDLYESEANFIARDFKNNEVELPFALYLKDFKLETYQPKLALVENTSGTIAPNNGKNLYLIQKGETYFFLNYEVLVKDYLPFAGRIGERYELVNEAGSPPAALLHVRNTETDSIKKSWISCGSFTKPFESFKISDQYSIVMTIPEAKKFMSDIEILSKDGSRIPQTLEVNKPYKYKGWKIYQLSYNDRMGKWSDLSVVELVRDPWLPVIYTGIFMMILGAIYIFWMGKNVTKTQEQ